MKTASPHTIFYSFLYGAATVLFVADLFFLGKAMITGEIFPIFPLLAGVCIAGGLVAILYAEGSAHEEEKKDHRRLSRVANQLEQPIASLEEDIEYLVRQSESLPAEVRLKLKRMNTKTRVLLENVRDVFLMIRVQEGPISQNMRTYDLCTLVGDAIERSKPLAGARNVEIVHAMHCVDAPVRVDKALLMIALLHLIENGILYTVTPGLVNIAVIRGKSDVRVVVQDRGIGVKKEDLGALFTPFARGSYANQYDPDGIGVGIALSRSILREFGGKLTMKQRGDSSGLEFEMKLPLALR